MPGNSAGAERRSLAQGRRHEDLQAALRELHPELADWADDFIFGKVWDRSALSHRDQMMVAIIALAATGKATQLRNYLHGALQGGIDAEELRDALTMLVVYVGFPTAIGALVVLQQTIAAEEKAAGRPSSP